MQITSKSHDFRKVTEYISHKSVTNHPKKIIREEPNKILRERLKLPWKC